MGHYVYGCDINLTSPNDPRIRFNGDNNVLDSTTATGPLAGGPPTIQNSGLNNVINGQPAIDGDLTLPPSNNVVCDFSEFPCPPVVPYTDIRCL